MGALTTALMVAGTAMSAVGQIQQGYAASAAAESNASLLEMQGRESQITAEYNAAVSRANAEAIRTSADLDIVRQRAAQKTFRGAQAAKYAGAGVKLEGSPLDVLIDTAAQFELDILITDFNAKTAISQQEFAAQQSLRAGRSAVLLAGMQAAQQRTKAKYYKRAGWIGAGSTLFETAAGFYQPSSKLTYANISGRGRVPVAPPNYYLR